MKTTRLQKILAVMLSALLLLTVAPIAAIGTVEYTPACKTKIDAARTAYNDLSDLYFFTHLFGRK